MVLIVIRMRAAAAPHLPENYPVSHEDLGALEAVLRAVVEEAPDTRWCPVFFHGQEFHVEAPPRVLVSLRRKHLMALPVSCGGRSRRLDLGPVHWIAPGEARVVMGFPRSETCFEVSMKSGHWTAARDACIQE